MATTLTSGNALLVIIDEGSIEEPTDLEDVLVTCLSNTLKKINPRVRVMSSEEVCTEIEDPFNIPGDILEHLAQNSPLKDRLGVEAVQYVLVVDQKMHSSGWRQSVWSFGDIGTRYWRRDIERRVTGTVIDVQEGEKISTVRLTRWASSGAGLAGASCIILPIGWIGIDDQELAVEEFCENVAKLLTGKNIKASPCEVKNWK